MAKIVIGEVLAIGDEIICGKLLDTNSQWLSQKMSELGVAVRYHSTIGDRIEDYRVALESACMRADLIVCSGGLGPTEDDLTSAALAELAGVDLEFDESSWAQIRSIFAKRNRPIAESNRKQAMRPHGSRVILNPNGTAPGIDLWLPEQAGRRVRVVALPGVPAEMREMWPAVATEIQAMVGQRVFFQYSLHCFGAGESDIEAMIPPEIMRRGRDPLVGITASQATISLRVSTLGQSVNECQRIAEPTIDQLRAVLGDLVYAVQDESLESVVLSELSSHGRSLGIVDMGLAGQVYQVLKRFDPSGRTIVGGVQVDEHSVGKLLLDLDQTYSWTDHLEAADQVRNFFHSDFGLAIGPLPDPAAAAQTFRVAISDGRSTWVPEISCAGHPAIRSIRATKGILNFLRLQVLR